MKKVITLVILAKVCFLSAPLFAQSTDTFFGTESRSQKYLRHFDEIDSRHFDQPSSGNNPLIIKDYWDSLFNKGNGYDSVINRGLVNAIAGDADNLYVGGSFEFFNGKRCYNIIHFDRITGIWNTMDSGFNATVDVLKIHNGKLYAGGRFNGVGFNGTTSLHSLVVWDAVSKKWVEIGGGVNNTVHTIEFMDTSIVVGGDFTVAGSTSTSYIARWDGHNWDNMGSTFDDKVNVVLPVGDSIFVGGDFSGTSDYSRNIALYYQGTWQPIGKGLSGSIYSLSMIKGKLWVGGDYTTTGAEEKLLSGLATWDGNNWNGFGSGKDTGIKGKEVYSIMPVGDSVYIGGSFCSVTGVPVHSLAKWSNGVFTSVGGGVYGEVTAMGLFNGSLYIGGTFLHAGNDSVGNLAQLNSGDILHSLSPPAFAYGGYSETWVKAVASTPQFVFIGGSFSTIAGKQFNHIAAWDKVNRKWISLGKGVDEEVAAITIQGNYVYVGGDFNYAGDSMAHHIAYWDMNTNTWHPMGEGSTRYISAIAANEAGIYAAIFLPYVQGGGLYNYIGLWDGNKWTQLNGAINGFVNTIAAKGSTLYVGGTFQSIDHVNQYSYIAQYDGGGWSQLGSGLSDEPLDIVLGAGSDIYVAGYFLNAGDTRVQGIARWDGTNWFDLQGGLDNYVEAIAWDGNSLYAGGNFRKTAGGLATTYLAKWDGSQWAAVSNGTSSTVDGLAVDKDGLYCGGSFNRVNGGNLNSYRFGILHFATSGVGRYSDFSTNIQNFPNPFAAETTISYSTDHDGPVKIEIYNVIGVRMKTLLNEFKSAGDYDVTLDAAEFPSGTYICSCTSDGVTQTKSINLVK